MNETTRTLTFAGIAAALAVAAYGMHASNQPPSLDEFSDVGTEFYPEFDNPRDATGLRVAAYNDDAARVDVFNVDFKNGLWRIPSHHDYPADGEERLANTATSIIGLERGALASTSADDHKRLGVLDPLDETITGTDGRGDRITLTKGDQTLADYIIGTKVEDGPENTFHVRRADENRTYRATLDLEISTKFADWIEPGLLDFRRGDVRELVIDRYSIDETRGVLVPGATSELSRAGQDDPWTLKDLDEKTQKVNTTTVNNMINALEDLKIVGVRRKPAGLSADLRGEGDGAMDGRVVFDLQQKGFFVDARGALVSNEGDVRMATADGAMYVLRFGEVFTGSDVEIEVGKSATNESDRDDETSEEKTGAADAAGADETSDDAAEADEAADAEADGEKAQKSRYVFITAQFDESLIAALPEKPVKPEPPADVDLEAKDPQTEGETTAEVDEQSADDKAASNDETKSAEDAKDEDKPDPKAEYEQALADYETRLKDWEARQKERDGRIEAGQQRVQELNERFADWYYVISADTFDKIRVTPEQLVEAAEPAEDAADAAASPAAPLTAPAVETTKEEMKDPTAPDDKPEPPKATDDKSAESEKPAGSDKPDEEKPAAEKPDAETKPAESAEDVGESADEKPSETDETPAGKESADDAS